MSLPYILSAVIASTVIRNETVKYSSPGRNRGFLLFFWLACLEVALGDGVGDTVVGIDISVGEIVCKEIGEANEMVRSLATITDYVSYVRTSYSYRQYLCNSRLRNCSLKAESAVLIGENYIMFTMFECNYVSRMDL